MKRRARPTPPDPLLPRQGPQLTDWGNAQRLVALHGRDLHYVYKWKQWLLWDGTRWATDAGEGVARRAKDVVNVLLEEAKAAADDTDLRRQILRWAIHSEHTARLAGMIDLARSEPGIPVTPEALDANPWLLNLGNGTLDLHTGVLTAPRREHLLTRRSPTPYDPAASCPQWDAFLAQIMKPHPDVIPFLQRAFGYALTGVIRDHVLIILHGSGSNGKGTLLDTVGAVLGEDYALETPVQTLMARHHDAIPNDVARLRGARLVVATESEGQHRLAEARVKHLTGGNKVVARFLHGEWFEFSPTHKLMLATNHKPVIGGTDHAIWRRIRLVPFAVTIPEADQDDGLGARLVAEEAAGILRWMVEGCAAWQRTRLDPPATVREATATYRADMDVIGGFLADKCDVEPLLTARAGALYAKYGEWCKASGEKAISKNLFAFALEERGFTKTRDKHGMVYEGLGLRPDDTDDDAPV